MNPDFLLVLLDLPALSGVEGSKIEGSEAPLSRRASLLASKRAQCFADQVHEGKGAGRLCGGGVLRDGKIVISEYLWSGPVFFSAID